MTNYIRYLVCCLSLASLKIALASYSFSTTELDALEDFYDSTNGENWVYPNNSVPWNFNQSFPNPCTEGWAGITCSSDCTSTPCVTEQIQLSQYNLNGTLSRSLSELTYLTSITLRSNYLHGTIPRTLLQLPNIQKVDLRLNNFTGSIPNNFTYGTRLVSLDFGYNLLHGTIPVEILSCPRLESLNLQYNRLTGTILNCMQRLPSLATFEISGNQITSGLPSSIYNLTQLKNLMVGYNMLTGSMEIIVDNLVNLEVLQLNNNLFTGTIPYTTTKLISLQRLALQYNYFTGIIPTYLGKIESLHYLNLQGNALTGSIPSLLGNIPNLYYLILDGNMLTQTIPAGLINCTIMTILSMANNMLTGTLPPALNATFGQISVVNVENNAFTGTLPFYKSSLWIAYEAGSNFFTGSIPNLKPTKITTLVYCSFANNLFFGTLPNTGSLFRLSFFDISYNMLSGNIVNVLDNAPGIANLFVNDNVFSGNLGDYNGAPPYIQQVDVSRNYFVGTIPTYIFQYVSLKSAIMSLNCFTGTLPNDICRAKSLQKLYLDGLHSATNCQVRLPFVSTYYLTHTVSGTIPSCLLSNMKFLQSLHLAGNSFSGELTLNNNTLNQDMNELILSYNKLSGTIPGVIYEREWNTLDLSFNHLNGEISDDIAGYNPSQALTLQVNRLSGTIPNQILNTTNITILQGNIFACGFKEANSQVPKNDPSYKSYSCGSNAVYISFMVYLIIMSVVLLMLLILKYELQWQIGWHVIKKRIFEIVSYPEPVIHDSPMKGISRFLLTIQQVRILVTSCTLFILIIIMPLNAILSRYYSTMSYQYVWTVSFSYLTGLVPAVTMLCMLYILLSMCWYLIYRFKGKKIIGDSGKYSFKKQVIKFCYFYYRAIRNQYKFILIAAMLFLMNLIIVFAVNVAYIQALDNTNYTAGEKGMITISVSLFKFVWTNLVVVQIAGSFLFHIFQTQEILSKYIARYLLFVSLFNNIIIPFIVEAFISPECYYYLIVKPPEVKTIFDVTNCVRLNFGNVFDIQDTVYCQFINNESIYFIPPFQYSFECSSSLLSAFIPVFIYRYIVGMIVRVCYIAYLTAKTGVVGAMDSSRSASTDNRSKERIFSDEVFMSLLPPITADVTLFERTPSQTALSWTALRVRSSSVTGMASSVSGNPSTVVTANSIVGKQGRSNSVNVGGASIVNPISESIVSMDGRANSTVNVNIGINAALAATQTEADIQRGTNVSATRPSRRLSVPKQILLKRQVNENTYFLIAILGDFGVLMTFGVLFPPLAFMICLSIFYEIQFRHWKISYLIKFVQRVGSSMEYLLHHVVLMNQELESSQDLTWSMIQIILYITGIFWSFSLFDTYGNEVGTMKAVWILVVISVAPFFTKQVFYWSMRRPIM